MKNKLKKILHPNLGIFMVAFSIGILSHHFATTELMASDKQYDAASSFLSNRDDKHFKYIDIVTDTSNIQHTRRSKQN